MHQTLIDLQFNSEDLGEIVAEPNDLVKLDNHHIFVILNGGFDGEADRLTTAFYVRTALQAISAGITVEARRALGYALTVILEGSRTDGTVGGSTEAGGAVETADHTGDQISS